MPQSTPSKQTSPHIINQVSAADSQPPTLTARIPRWRQISDDLREAIESGQIKPGQILPSETQLRETYTASTGTVRRAIEELRNIGLVATEHGRGTIVRDQGGQTLTFNPVIARVPGENRFKVWDATWRTTHRELLRGDAAHYAKSLQCSPKEPIFILERHLLDPAGRDVITHRVIQRITDVDDLGDIETYRGYEPQDLYARLTEAGYTVTWNDTITLAHATAEDIQAMTMPRGVPVLLHTRITEVADRRPIALEETRLPGHRAAIRSHSLM